VIVVSDNIAIRIRGLGKKYAIGGPQERYLTFRDAIVKSVKAPFKRLTQKGYDEPTNEFWALKDVSFDVHKGEVVGIIGRNGAGKSTLLKILSRITTPTEGEVDIYGRVGSLLEVGTGFHPELTGAENIFLSGSILGMKKTEIEQKFDEIVKFSEIEKFIDTPVKRYSSGMYVRLAFAVAAHLDPEILIVDEVLAVGDASFQKKCLGKMGDVAKEGRTVLFVSHNMKAVQNLCTRTIWINNGIIQKNGNTAEVVETYLKNSLKADIFTDLPTVIRSLPNDPALEIKDVIISQDGTSCTNVINSKPIKITIQYIVKQKSTGLRVYFDLLDEEKNILIRSFHDDDADSIPTIEPGEYISSASIPGNLLAPRTYELRIRGTIFNVRSCAGDGIEITLVVEPTSKINRGYAADTIRSKLQPKIDWVTQKV
jgi:lipopolysaccharide transport system ATP-binding protein